MPARLRLHLLFPALLLLLAGCGNSNPAVLLEVLPQEPTDAVDAADADAVLPDLATPDVPEADLPETDLSGPDLCVPECGDRECGDDGCGGSCGTCPGVAPLCVEGYCQVECIPDCTDKECGGDGCGGECGTCPAIAPICVDGMCQLDCTPDCTDKECGDDGCGGSCGSCPEAAPLCVEGKCEVDCTPDCEGKECGDDGCGGSCGKCPAAAPLCVEGLCEVDCAPDCEGKECGPDGCLGSCGECDEGSFCNQGICEAECLSDPGCDETGQVQCIESGLGFVVCAQVQEGCFQWSDVKPCGEGFECQDGACVESCLPQCAGKACGPDGCGGSCGSCPDETFCQQGTCVPVCVSDEGCDEAGLTECTEDSLGTTTCEEVEADCFKWSEPAPCGAGFACADGECYELCEAQCEGKECGGDGCGGSCGTCGAGEKCDAGQCVPICVPSCAGKQCGGDGCGGSCGTCPAGHQCANGGQCVCVPSCAGKQCGSDGCGGTCGACDDGNPCTVDTCTPAQTCTHAPVAGCCVTDADCTGGKLCVAGLCKCPFESCGASCCAFDETCVLGLCIPKCTPQCEGKACGSDGCGGSCGTCAAPAQCTPDGQCLDKCELACVGKACGSDGCGGSCGTCGAGLTCTDGGQCVAQCVPNCTGKQCGPNGCGGSCGSCPNQQFCNAGVCSPQCVPDCDWSECGDDGCGGSCGACDDGVLCTAAGVCGGACMECNGEPACSDLTFAEGTLANWNIEAAVVLTKLGATVAPTGGHMLKLTTGEGLTEVHSGVAFQTCLEPGSYGVIIDWKFYSEEFKEWCGSQYQDGMHLWLEVGGEVVEVEDLAIKALCPPDACNGCGASYVGLEQSDVSFDQGGVWNTPWSISTKGIVVPADAPVVTLHLELSDAGDAIYDTVLLVDRVRFLPCGAYCDLLDCGAEPVCDCGACPAGTDCVQGTCCVPDCEGKECGDDGCGGTCGPCAGICEDGICCVPGCDGKECGDDGCGGSCGSCWGLEDTCVDGLCVCVPDCEGKECGNDGCGGTCGACDDGLPCSLDTCTPEGVCLFDDSACCTEDGECDDGSECTVDSCVDGTCENAAIPDCCIESVFDEDFDSGQAAGWTLTLGVDGVGWNVYALPGQNGGSALYYGNPLTENFDNGQPNSGYVFSPPINLPAGQRTVLSFDLFMEVEPSVNYDRFYVAISVEGGAWMNLFTKAQYQQMETWQAVNLDLSSLAGSQVRVRFLFETVDGVGNTGLGVLVDNVVLSSDCSALDCQADEECDDDVPATVGSCQEGECLFEANQACSVASQCNDGDACTQNQCVLGYCAYLPYESCCYADADCADDLVCTVDICDKSGAVPKCVYEIVAGCCVAGDACDDGNLCTIDECDVDANQCVHGAIPGCCLDSAGCDDDDGCTYDLCIANECAHPPACCQVNGDCDDGDDCTDDSCVAAACQYLPNQGEGCCVPPLFNDDFSTDKGWSYGTDWERGEAQASPPSLTFTPDPATDHSTTEDNFLAGVLIGGNTTKTVHSAYYLTSPVIDLSGAVTPYVSFWRFLNSDYASYMTNTVEVFNGQAWQILWQSGSAPGVKDSQWTFVEHDVTAYKNAQFRVRFGYAVGSAGVYSCPSWSVDDVMVVDKAALADSALCCAQLSDCQGTVPDATGCVQGACQP